MIRLLLLGMIHLYRWTLSPLLAFIGGPGSGCRFTPTCSEYALEAVRLHGSGRGAWLALRRLLRCHPWGGWGYDPVPALDLHTEKRRHLRPSFSSPTTPPPAHTSPSSPH